ncbi:retrovirus-related pol polyprotein from transposon TNT 1-94 [Tanacetum coccineum]|uniref:Retrovirus-related pol polyprotein from transposon TNT 1-94 n=1 Tax=Tanacetum coccineum TaxID=301880 RepID=A0ABQ5A0H1_9ASTR
MKLDEYGGVLNNKSRLVAKENGSLSDGCEDGVSERDLKEEVYVSQPERFVNQENPNHVFRLKKALYGLKQAPRAWYDLLSKFLLRQKFVKGVVDLTLFIRKERNDHILIPSVPPQTVAELVLFVICMYARYQAKPTEKHLTMMLTKQILWMRLVNDSRFDFNKIPLYSESKSAIALSCNTIQHSRTKHIVVRYYFIKEQDENEVVELYFVNTDYQLANIFIKALARERFEFLIKRLGMQIITPEKLKRLTESDEE